MSILLPAFLLPPTLEDIKTREVKNLYWVLIVVARCIFLIAKKDKDGLISGLLGVLVAALIFFFAYLISKDGIGLGDVKLMLAVAFYLGLELFLRALFFISLISALFSLILLAVKQATKKTTLPFVPFILAGTSVATFIEVIR